VNYPDLYIKFIPGTQYAYSGEGFFYLAKVIAHLTNRTLQTLEPLYEQEVSAPLDMQHAWFTGNDYIAKHKVSGHVNGKVQVQNGQNWPIAFPNHDSSYFNPAASLHCDVSSYANFIINGLTGKGLRENSFDEMIKPQYRLPEDPEKPSEHPAVGLGIFMTTTPYGTCYQHGGNNGNFQSNFVWYKSLESGYVYFTNCNKSDDFDRRLKEFFTNGK
jgi:CubicO group peptidase (beta-lactamase class C family)